MRALGDGIGRGAKNACERCPEALLIFTFFLPFLPGKLHEERGVALIKRDDFFKIPPVPPFRLVRNQVCPRFHILAPIFIVCGLVTVKLLRQFFFVRQANDHLSNELTW